MAIGFAGVGGTLVGTGFVRITADTASAEKSIGALGKIKAVSGALFAGFALAGAESIKTAMTFQTEMTKIQTQAGASAKDVQVLSSAVLQLAPSTQQGPVQLSEALFHLKSIGLDNVDAMKALKVASDLAAVGGANLEDTTNAIGGAWRSGIAGAQDFGQAAATVNAIIGAGNMRMQDFVSAIGTGILPSARTFGVSLSSVGAALALMTDEGIPAVDAATRLRMSFSLMGAPSKAAENQLRTIGLTGLQLADAMRGPNGVIGAIQLLKDHLDASGLSASQQAMLLSRAFGGGRSNSAILTMLNNLDTLKKKQDQINQSMGNYGPAVEAQRKTAEAQFKMLESGLQALSIRLGSALLPPVVKLVAWINTNLIPAVGRVTTAFMNLVPVSSIEAGIRKLVDDFDKLFGIGQHKAAPISAPLSTLYGVKGGKGPSPLPVGIAAPTGSLTSNPSDIFKILGAGSSQSISSDIAAPVSKAISGIDWGSIGKSIGGSLGKALMGGFDLMAMIGKWFGKVDWVTLGKQVGGQAIPFIIGFVVNLFQPLMTGSFWSKHWGDILMFAATVIPVGRVAGLLGKFLGPFLPEVLKGGLEGISKFGGLFEKLLGGLFKISGKVLSAIGLGIADGFDEVFNTFVGNWLEKQVPKFAESMKGFFSGIGSKIKSVGKSVAQFLFDGLLSGLELLGSWVGTALGYIAKGFATAGKWLWKSGANLVDGLLGGILDAFKSIGTWIGTNILNPVVKWFKNLFGIASPSTVMAAIGVDIINGLLAGFLKITNTFGDWLLTNVFHPVVNFFSGALTWLVSAGSYVIQGFINGNLAIARTIGAWLLNNILHPVVHFFDAAANWLLNAGASVIRGFINGNLIIARTLGTWYLSNIYRPVLGFFAGAASWLFSHGADLIKGLVSGAGSALSAIGHWAASVYNAVVGAIKNVFGIKSPSTVMAGLGGHMMTGLMNGLLSGTNLLDSVVKRIFSSPIDAAKALISKGFKLLSIGGKDILSFSSQLGSSILSMLGISSGSTSFSGSVASWLLSALGLDGMPASWLGGLETLVGKESGGNPSAVNSTPVLGQHATGLLQMLPSTFAAHMLPGRGNILNPVDNAASAIRYIAATYGSPANIPGLYGGTYVGYDEGGWLPKGLSMVANRTGHPERIMPHQQGGQGGELHVHVHLDHSIVGSERELEDWLIGALQRAKRSNRLHGLVGT